MPMYTPIVCICSYVGHVHIYMYIYIYTLSIVHIYAYVLRVPSVNLTLRARLDDGADHQAQLAEEPHDPDDAPQHGPLRRGAQARSAWPSPEYVHPTERYEQRDDYVNINVYMYIYICNVYMF